MMFAVVILALIAVGLVAVTVGVRRRLFERTAALEQRSAELGCTRDELRDAIDRAEEEAQDTELRLADTELRLADTELRLADTESGLADGDQRLRNAATEISDLNDEIEEADRLAEHQSAELASMAIETEELAEQLAEALKRFATKPTTTTGLVDPAVLWELELARSERTWRYSVAIYPDDVSPFADAANPLQLAVETEAAALRDDVGAFLSVDWQAGLVEDPARSHLILRVAQELLAKAARIEEPAVLIVAAVAPDESDTAIHEAAGDKAAPRDEAFNDVVLRVVPADEGDAIRLDLSEFGDQRLGSKELVVDADNGELSVTVLDVR